MKDIENTPKGREVLINKMVVVNNTYSAQIKIPDSIESGTYDYYAASGTLDAGGYSFIFIIYWSKDNYSSCECAIVRFNGTTGTNTRISTTVNSVDRYGTILIENSSGSGVLSLSNIKILSSIIVMI